MGASGREFLMMREEEETGQLYVPVLSKREIKAKAQEKAKSLLEDEDSSSPETALIDASRISEYLKELITKLREGLNAEELKDFECKGAKFVFKSGSKSLNYQEDEVYSKLKELLKEREELLKVAAKSKEVVFDSEQNPVPKVSCTYGQDSINLSY